MECVCAFEDGKVTSMCGAHTARAREWADDAIKRSNDRMQAKLEAVERERDQALIALGRAALRHN